LASCTQYSPKVWEMRATRKLLLVVMWTVYADVLLSRTDVSRGLVVQKSLQQRGSQALGDQSCTFRIEVRAIEECRFRQFRMLKRQHDEYTFAGNSCLKLYRGISQIPCGRDQEKEPATIFVA
jgi:hypothetical protein